MSAVDEKNISRYLFNPFAVFVADVGDSKPATQSFYTEPGIGLSFNKEFVEAMAYTNCNGIKYTVRQDPTKFDFRVAFSIKETTINTLKLAHGGTVGSEGEIILDGKTQDYSLWLESCYNDDGKIIRITIPKAKSVDPQEVSSGESHVIHTTAWVALVDPADTGSFPSIYIEE